MPTLAEVRSKFPMYSDLSDSQLLKGLHSKFYSDMPYQDFLGSIDFKGTKYDAGEVKNPTSDMSTLQKSASGAGKAFVDIGRGVGQLTGITSQSDIDQAKARDIPLMKTGAGLAGNIIGNAAAFAPTAFIPGANTYTGAAAIGAGMGALQPVATGESRSLNAGIGAGAGAAGQALGRGISRVLQPIRNQLSPQVQDLAQAAERQGIPLTAGQATGSRPLQVAESVMENLPFTSAPQLAIREGQQQAFNRAVGRTFGENADAMTPQVMGQARNRIGQQFTDLAARNTLNADRTLMDELGAAQLRANRELTPDVARLVNNRIDDILARVDAGNTMPGTAYRALDSEMGRQVRNTANGDVRHAIGEIRGTLRSAMDRSISDADSAAWQNARRQYANLMTVAPEAAKSATGDISGRTLLSAANRGNPNARFGANSDLAGLGRIGREFVAEQIPNSGTAQRQFIQSLLTGGGGSLIGAGAAAGTGRNPLEGAAYGAGIAAGGLATPRLIQMLMNSAMMQAYLRNGLVGNPAVLSGIPASTSLALPAAAMSSR